MKPKIAILICLVMACCLTQVDTFADGADVRGVITNDRVVNLPKDSEKWYISVAGTPGEAQYRMILKWFNEDADLRKLKIQVHYRAYDSNTIMFKERFAPNVRGLPTVRMQKNSGEVVYEAQGDNLPLSARGLHGALMNSSNKARGLLFRPWRRGRTNPCPLPNPAPNNDRGCPNGLCPRPRPDPPVPPKVDPPPAPLSDTVVIQPEASGLDPKSAGLGAGVALLCLAGGAIASLVVQWRRRVRT